MTSAEIVEKGKSFADQLSAKLSDPTETVASKQVYFMDNHANIQKIMGALGQVITQIESATKSDDADVSDEDLENLSAAKEIVTNMKKSISDFQQLLLVDKDVKEEDTVTPITEETLTDATKNNKTTQRMMEGLEAVSQAKQVPYNYALICDGTVNLLAAADKNELNKAINAIANNGNYKDINLFQLTFTPVPLRKKTVLSV